MKLNPTRILPASSMVFALALAGFGALVASTTDLHAPKSFAWDLLALGIVYALVLASLAGVFCASGAIEASEELPRDRKEGEAPIRRGLAPDTEQAGPSVTRLHQSPG